MMTDGGPATSTPPWVLVSAGFHEQGGQSRANAALADYLIGCGTPVHLVGHDFDGRFRRDPGCALYPVARPLGADLLGVLALRRHGRRIARRVVDANAGARVLVNGGCCQWADINWVHYVHAGWPATSARPPLLARCKDAVAGSVFRRHERRALRMARVVLANSQLTRRLLVDRLDLDPDAIHTVYLGSDPAWGPATPEDRRVARNWLKISEDRPLVVFVGGLGHDERKGFDTLWTAWQVLCADLAWDGDLVVAGSGAAATPWQRRIAAAGLTKRVRFLGFTDRVRDLLAAADVLVSPTRYEPYGLNVQEAICRGVPALVTACAGVAEQYPAALADMVLPDPNDATDLARRLRGWRADLPGWRRRFAGLSRALRSYSWAEMAERIVALAEARDERIGESKHEHGDVLHTGRPGGSR